MIGFVLYLLRLDTKFMFHFLGRLDFDRENKKKLF